MKVPMTSRGGFSLVEVTLAMGVVSVCLITVFGLFSVGLQSSQNAVQESAIVNAFDAVIADLRATPVTEPRGQETTSQQFGIHVPAAPIAETSTSTLFFDRCGQFSTSPNPESLCRLTIRFLSNAGSRTATLVHLKMTWPAQALPASALGSEETFLGLDRN